MNKKKTLWAALLALSLLAGASSFAEEVSETNASPAPAEQRRFELDVAGSYSAGLRDESSRKPGLSLFLGYKLSPWSTLGLQFASRANGTRGAHNDYEEFLLSYKHWLSLGQWSPYLQVGAGYGQVRSSQLGSFFGIPTETIYAKRGNFAFQLGGGYRYSLTKDVGLDFGLHYLGLGSPGNFHDKFLVSKIGFNVAF